MKPDPLKPSAALLAKIGSIITHYEMIASSAEISPCGHYRYHLQRTWDESLPRLCWIMLNPSTANWTEDDATIRICKGRAKRMGFGRIDVVNLFALRSTDPLKLYDAAYPISDPTLWFKNDAYIHCAARKAQTVICAWGSHGVLLNRGTIVLSLLREAGIRPMVLRQNQDASPSHPLRISYDTKPYYL